MSADAQTAAARSKPSLAMRRNLPASPDRCFRAWTDAEELKRWFSPGANEVVLAETDPRVGGRYRVVMRSPDGEEHEVSGEFREVLANRKLVFTWAWRGTPERQSLVTVEFLPAGDATLVTLTHEEFADDAARDRHHRGWTGSLDRLAALVS
jgi:uncharacterized protein YndB with AHSA1/START domain